MLAVVFVYCNVIVVFAKNRIFKVLFEVFKKKGNGSFQKRSILHPQRKFPSFGKGERNCLKNVINLYRMSREEGVFLIFSVRGMHLFWNNPINTNVHN